MNMDKPIELGVDLAAGAPKEVTVLLDDERRKLVRITVHVHEVTAEPSVSLLVSFFRPGA